MISTLPRWVEYGAFILAAVAGFVNATGLLGFEHQSVSHLSGTATLLGAELAKGSLLAEGSVSAEGSLFTGLHLIGVLFSFLVGSAISGYFINGRTLKIGRNYSAMLCLEAVLLFLACYLLIQNSIYGHYLASAACGLQNAFATTFSGAIVRTTHVTGIFTDLGIMLGAKLKGEAFDRRKAILFTLIIIGFVFGAVAGAFTFKQVQFYALLFPASICVLLAITFYLYKLKRQLKEDN